MRDYIIHLFLKDTHSLEVYKSGKGKGDKGGKILSNVYLVIVKLVKNIVYYVIQ